MTGLTEGTDGHLVRGRSSGGGLEFLEYFFGTTQRVLDVFTDVRGSDDFLKLCLMNQFCRLFPRATQEQSAARGLEPLGSFFESEEAGCVQGCHVA